MMRFAFPAVSLAVLLLPAPALRFTVGPRPGPAALPALRFGAALAIAGDQILVGRPGGSRRVNAPLGGVHVFHRGRAGQWVEAAVLAPRDLTAAEAFGTALAVDGALLAVGAPGANEGRGAIYLFQRDRMGRWQQRAKLRAAAGAAGDSLGSAVALRGGLLLAGAPGHGNRHGMAVVFRQGANPTTWTEQATLAPRAASAAPDTASQHSRFGDVLAIADGRLIVSAPGLGYYSNGEVPGQVVVFRDSAQAWVEEARLTAPAGPQDYSELYSFGTALAADGARLWVSSRQGAVVYEFRRDGAGRWAEGARIRSATAGGQFGRALAYSGGELVVSDPSGDHALGTLYVFRFDSARTVWTEVQHLAGPAVAVVSYGFGQQLAVGHGLLVTGDPRIPEPGAEYNDGKETVVIYQRTAAQGGWQQPAATVTDTAWNPWTGKPLTGTVSPCTQGKVYRVFDCQHVDLLAYLPAAAIGMGHPAVPGSRFPLITDIWGWTDSATQREFALVGRSDGTAFVEVTDPVHPRYLGTLPVPASGNPSIQHTIKVYQHHAFIVGDPAGAHGVQVFDLTQLLSVKAQDIPVMFQETARYDRVGSVHNIIIDTTAGFAYATGAGGLHIIDIRDPKHPTYAGQAPMDAHDAQCVTYHGPDQHYQGHQICINANVSEVGILDVTNKQDSKVISTASYPNIGIAHQGWFTDDQRYFVLDDEGCAGAGGGACTIVLDLRDLGDPVVAKEFFSPAPSTAHNLYVRGPYAYQGNYKAGLRVLDLHDPVNPKEVGYFDTMPFSDNSGGMVGAWGTYPFFKSGAIAVTSMLEGLFLVRFKPPAPPRAGRRPTSP